MLRLVRKLLKTWAGTEWRVGGERIGKQCGEEEPVGVEGIRIGRGRREKLEEDGLTVFGPMKRRACSRRAEVGCAEPASGPFTGEREFGDLLC